MIVCYGVPEFDIVRYIMSFIISCFLSVIRLRGYGILIP